jgi:hypothetical protein
MLIELLLEELKPKCRLKERKTRLAAALEAGWQWCAFTKIVTVLFCVTQDITDRMTLVNDPGFGPTGCIVTLIEQARPGPLHLFAYGQGQSLQVTIAPSFLQPHVTSLHPNSYYILKNGA